MTGRNALRVCMYGLVLLNLVFVQITQAAGTQWLVPLYALTLFSPFLVRFQEKMVYRALWNGAVIGIFALLVQHATGRGLHFLLEDGLVLAALCQVHLLNNLRSDQRPDILFFNSFLIAVVTGYLSQDLAYLFAFMAYAPMLVIGLQLWCVSSGGVDLSRVVTRRVVKDGLFKSAALLTVTLAVFLFWPRDFQRRGMFGTGQFPFVAPGSALEIGFAEEVDLDREGRAVASDRIVMRAKLVRGTQGDVPPHWRGSTLAFNEGNAWRAMTDEMRAAADGSTWVKRPRQRTVTRGGETSGPILDIENVDPQANRLFTPLEARYVSAREGIRFGHIHPWPDDTLHYGKKMIRRPPINYRLRLSSKRPSMGGATPKTWPTWLRSYVQLPIDVDVASARQLADQLAEALPEDADQHRLVSAMTEYLSTRHSYLLPGEDGAAKSLDEFLSGAPGHCEFFASALATMLRSRGVPCRLATGYRGSEWDPEGRVLTVRRRDGHAWVEVYDPEAGWYAVDPSPAAEPPSGPGLWEQMKAGISEAWAGIVTFDDKRRAAMMEWFRTLPARSYVWVQENPGSAALTILSLVLAFALSRIHRFAGHDRNVLAYRRALRRCGLRLEKGETPREALDRARGAGVAGKRLDVLASATSAHEAARYAAV